jgi:hypothetical protein
VAPTRTSACTAATQPENLAGRAKAASAATIAPSAAHSLGPAADIGAEDKNPNVSANRHTPATNND